MHSIFADLTNPAENRIQFFDIQYFYLTFAFNFADLDPPWRLPGSLPGRYLVSNLVAEKHSISRVLRHSTPGTEGLQAILKGANRKKTIQFPADPGVYQALSWSCPGVSR